MKRQLPSTSSVAEPQRNVRSRNRFQVRISVCIQQARQRAVSSDQPHGFQPGVQSMAPHQSPTSVSRESISGSSDAPQSLQPLAGSTAIRVRVQHGSLISALDERGISISSEVPPPASDPLVPSTAPNLRSHIPASEERSVPLPSTSPVVEPRRNVRSCNPFARSMPPHFCVSTQQTRQRAVTLEQPPPGIQPGVQSMSPNPHADHQNPTSVPGESISGSTAPRVSAQHRSLISAPDERGISLSLEVAPPASDPSVPSTAPHVSRVSLPRAPPWRFTRVILSSEASPAGSHSSARLTAPRLSEQHQNSTISNHSQDQNPHIMPADRHRGMPMDTNRMSYEELLALGERIGKVNTGVKTSELSKFVKKVICCGEQDEAEQCVICLEQYADADVKGQLKCNHQYHFSCIGKWMEEQAVCPICRQRAAQFEQ